MKPKNGVFNAFDAHEKEILHGYLKILLDANEPAAMLGSLKRIAERKAFGVTLGRIDAYDAQKWQRLADTITLVEKELSKPKGVKVHAI